MHFWLRDLMQLIKCYQNIVITIIAYKLYCLPCIKSFLLDIYAQEGQTECLTIQTPTVELSGDLNAFRFFIGTLCILQIPKILQRNHCNYGIIKRSLRTLQTVRFLHICQAVQSFSVSH